MLRNRRIIVIVPARGGSKGVPLKNIRPVNGIPLIALVGKVVSRLPFVDKAIVSTDHEEIAKIAASSGLEVPFMRPAYLAGDMVSDWEVLHHALTKMEEIDKHCYEIIVMLQPTSPLRKPEHVEATILKLIEGNYDAVWTISETDSKHHPLKQLLFEDDLLEYYDSKGSQIVVRQQLSPVYHRNGICYAFSRQCILDQKTIKGKRTSAVIIRDLVVNIDTELDLKLAEFFLKNRFN